MKLTADKLTEWDNILSRIASELEGLPTAAMQGVYGASPVVMAGEKHDFGKPRFTLVPRRALGAIVEVLEFGAKKYGAWNWVEVPNPKERYLDALMRHVDAWRSGERFDVESGRHHLAHAGCCVLFLLGLELGDHLEERGG